MITHAQLQAARAIFGMEDDSLHDSKDHMTDSEKNRALASQVAGAWGNKEIGAILRRDGDPRGQWDLYRLS